MKLVPLMVTVPPDALITSVPLIRQLEIVMPSDPALMSYTPSVLTDPPTVFTPGASTLLFMVVPGAMVVARPWYIAKMPAGGIGLVGASSVTPPLAEPDPDLLVHWTEPVRLPSSRMLVFVEIGAPVAVVVPLLRRICPAVCTAIARAAMGVPCALSVTVAMCTALPLRPVLVSTSGSYGRFVKSPSMGSAAEIVKAPRPKGVFAHQFPWARFVRQLLSLLR